MRAVLFASTAMACFALPASADDPTVVGTITGTYFYDPPGFGFVTGEELNIADQDGTMGSYSLSAGESNTLRPGSDSGSTRDPRLAVGFAPGALGFLLVDGPGANITMEGGGIGLTMDLGTRGTGVVDITNGGSLVLSDPNNTNASSSASIQIGKEGGNGTLTVDAGTVSVSSSADAFLFLGALSGFVGNSGGGSATVSVVNGSNLNINALAPIVTLPGGDDSEASIVLGQDINTINSMTVDNSTVVVSSETSSAGLSVAREQGSRGTFLLTNGATMWIDAGTTVPVANPNRYQGAFLDIGRDAGTNGNMTISGGASLAMTSGTDGGFIGVGREEGGFGRLTVEGGGTLSYLSSADDGFMEVGQSAPATASGGIGLVTVTGTNSRIDIDGDISVGNSSGPGISTGIMTVSNGGVISAGTINFFDGGILRGSGGSVVANVFAHSGSFIQPGLSPGDLTIDGDLTMIGGSTLTLEFGGSGPGEFDVLNIFGDLMADGPFTLALSFLNGYTPVEGTEFDVLNVTGNIDENFFSLAQFDILGLGSARASFSGERGMFSVAFTEVAPIPLPASFWFLASALGLMVVRKRVLS
jgi:T5SS/PEP-CTERM-associated repeat protein